MKITLGKKKLTANANEIDTNTQNQALTTQSNEDVQKTEIIELRGRNQRIYSCGVNKTLAEYHSNAIFYQGNDGEYHEIDNRLEDNGDVYEAKNNSFQTRFYKQSPKGHIFDINKKGCKISLTSLDTAKNCKCGLENCICEKATKNEGIVRFKSIKENIDLEYLMQSDRVKENIIINKASENYEYDFEIDIDGMYVSVSKDGKNLEFKRKETGKKQYHIPAPFMIDGKGKRSESVYYEITQETEDKLQLKVIADKEWINAKDRVFPVKIDPQVIVDNYYGEYAYSDANNGNNGKTMFSYRTLHNGEKTNLNVLWLYVNGDDIYESELVINKSFIPEKLLKNVKRATLYITTDKHSNAAGNFLIGENEYWSCDYDLEADVTKEFVSSKEDDKEIIISFKIGDYDTTSPRNIMFNSIHLNLESNVDYYGDEENILPVNKIIASPGGVQNIINLKGGKNRVAFSSFNNTGFMLTFPISHIYNEKFGETQYGKNWKLNLSKTLKVAEEDTEKTTKYVYMNEYGDEYLFIEKYYYIYNEEKHFVNKNSVKIDSEGKLSFNNHIIYREQICNGCTLIPNIDDFINVELIDQRQEKIAQLEDYVNQYGPTLESYAKVSASTGTIYFGASISTINAYKNCIKDFTDSSPYVLMTTAEAYQLQLQYLNLKQITLEIDNPGDEVTETDMSDLKKKKEIIKNQIDLVIQQARNNLETVKSIAKNYFIKEAELELLRKQIPVNYVKNGNGMINGFNKVGNLVFLSDSYGNCVSINYDEKNNISEITDSKNTTLKFRYEDELLISITNGQGAMVKYQYTEKELSQVTFEDKKSLQFKYFYSQPSEIIASECERTKYKYDDIGRIKLILSTSKYNEISKEDITKDDEYKHQLSKYVFSYPTDEITSVSDAEDNTENYTFDEERLTKYEKTDNKQNTTIVDYSYLTSSNGTKTITESTTYNGKSKETKKTEYNISGKILSEIISGKKISDTVEEQTKVSYTYNINNLPIEVKTINSRIQLDGKQESYITYTKYWYNAQGMPVLTGSYISGEENTSGKTYESIEYDDIGNEKKRISWNSLDGSTKFYKETTREENGRILQEKMEDGEIGAEYEYLAETNILNTIKYPDGRKFSYGRNPHNYVVTAITESTQNDSSETNNILYKNDLVVEVKSGKTVINYSYDFKGRKIKTEINGVEQSKISYKEYASNDSQTIYDGVIETLNDGTTIETESIKTSEGFYYKTIINNTLVLEKQCEKDGKLIAVKDTLSGTTYFSYDNYDNLTKIKTEDNSKVLLLTETYTYNENSELTKRNISGLVNHTYNYVYKSNSKHTLDYVEFNDYKFYPLNDVNGRNKGKEIYKNSTKIAAEYITYRKIGDHATNIPTSIYFGKDDEVKESIKYKYDSCGKITEIIENGHIYAKYTYDGNRLIREDNKLLNKTTIYTYGINGNISERCEYNYTSKTDEELSELSCTHYSYNYDGDKLISYNGENCSYNELGNPMIYRGKTITWQYGKFITKLGNTTFVHDGKGRRIKKDNISFTYDNEGRLIKQSNGLEFIYDFSNLIGIRYNETEYFYRKDCQGNIIAILDNAGKVIVVYKYDAWGNHAILDASGKDITDTNHIGNLNPFRYRGYYYDTETDLYYLQTRYYDPEVGRFISRDAIEYADPETILGLNLYAYCANNPVMNVDPTGTAWWDFILTGLGIIAGAVFGGIAGAFVGTVGGFLVGLAAGGIPGALAGAVIGGLVGGAIGAVGGAVIGGALGHTTANDINLLVKGNTGDENNDVYYTIVDNKSIRIKNSYKIKTPWVQWGYSFYLNHINPSTKDIIKGSTAGMQYEWFLHNVAYSLRIERGSSKDVDLDASIFADPHNNTMGYGMKISYMLLFNPIYWIWDLIASGGH